jgi:hypothetical protein
MPKYAAVAFVAMRTTKVIIAAKEISVKKSRHRTNGPA